MIRGSRDTGFQTPSILCEFCEEQWRQHVHVLKSTPRLNWAMLQKVKSTLHRDLESHCLLLPSVFLRGLCNTWDDPSVFKSLEASPEEWRQECWIKFRHISPDGTPGASPSLRTARGHIACISACEQFLDLCCRNARLLCGPAVHCKLDESRRFCRVWISGLGVGGSRAIRRRQPLCLHASEVCHSLETYHCLGGLGCHSYEACAAS